MIKVVNASKFYISNGNKQIALDKINLSFPDKGLVVICGASGCGKTTLLNVLGGLDKLDEGELIIDDKSSNNFTNQDWDSYRNQKVGFIFQQYYLLPHLNVFDNVAITLQMSNQNEGIKEKVEEALKQVDIFNLKNKYPRQLSGGEAQRVAIARAIISSPSLVLADEPTGALDEKNAIKVMEILKNISKEHLVVLVTHNKDLADKYADRLIEISYGKIKEDKELINENVDNKQTNFKKVHLPFFINMKWAFRNLVKRKSRSISLLLATSLGLAAVGIVLSLSSGLTGFTAKVQEQSLGQYPVYFTSYSENSMEAKETTLIEYPDTDKLLIGKDEYYLYSHYNAFSDDFMTYMKNIPESYYSYLDTNVVTNFAIFTHNLNGYSKISSSSYFTKISESNREFSYLVNQYDLLKGSFVDLSKEDECLLVVDKYNRITASQLVALGFNIEEDYIDFDDILAKEYHIVFNNDYYLKKDIGDGKYIYSTPSSSTYEDLYLNKSSINLKIRGIIREKKEAFSNLFSTGIIYSPALLNKINEQAKNSDIVKDQLAWGLDVDVLTGKPFEEIKSTTYTYSKEYSYESRLINLGYKNRATSLYFYTDSFDNRFKIIDYFEKYQMPEGSGTVIRSRDYLEQVTSSFSGLIRTCFTIIFFFAFASIVIVSILTAILTYISVLERNKEIGLLRSIGARRVDISSLFIVESSIVGVVSSFIADILIVALLPLVGSVLVKLISEYGYKAIQPTVNDIASFQFWVFIVVFVSSILISILSSLIPAIIAGRRKPVDCLKE